MIDLDELMRLHEAATPGPWKVKNGDFESEDGYGTVTAPYVEADGKTICVPFDRGPDDDNDEDDAAYIVAACNAVPELVARIRELEDAAGFEARVAKKLCDPFWNYSVTERYFDLALPYRRLPASVVLKAARLEVEADMIREGKGPGSPEEE